ncbi:cation:proton antiporter [uncultured Thiohalocapsa sp.]|uniref:cation:proton antiporter domain-containing protein n=1 Tax=uncultured Thiohalocapsa sp. TaxID=768990 RepID=UPI0025F24C67|nr:cation:proton antiporter [uncultured Thiohalocapsa sp.]
MLQILSFYAVLLALALVLEPLARRARLPFGAVLVLLGFAAAELWIGIGGDTGLHWRWFDDLVFQVLLPILIFEAAYNLAPRHLLCNLLLILTLALPVMLLSTALIGALLYVGIAHASGFPWLAALIAGALLSATDPAAVLELLRRIGAPPRLLLLLDGEGLFNDANAIVLFTLLVALATGEQSWQRWDETALAMVGVLAGGALVGLAGGSLAALLGRVVAGPAERGVLTLVAAYGAFAAAVQLGVSGVVAVLCAGLMLGRARRAPGDEALSVLWAYKAWLANTLLFLIAGITVQPAMFTDQWLAILIGIGATLAARAAGVFLLLPLAARLPGSERLPTAWYPLLWWGGTRGAVTLALALSLPVELPYWWTIQSIAYGVVLWTLLVQAGSMPLVLRWLRP